jgi:hypothetical protein
MKASAVRSEPVAGIEREKEKMHPLLFVNWSSVSSMFRGLMWIVAIALAAVIIVHLVPTAPSAHHAARLMR